MTISRLCPQCGALGANTGLCDGCQRADNKRRNQKRRDSGRTTAAWQRLRLAAMHRDGNTCRHCGTTGDRYTLTVHLAPELEGQHWRAGLADLVTLCRRCHGSVDAPRAHVAKEANNRHEQRRQPSEHRMSKSPASTCFLSLTPMLSGSDDGETEKKKNA